MRVPYANGSKCNHTIKYSSSVWNSSKFMSLVLSVILMCYKMRFAQFARLCIEISVQKPSDIRISQNRNVRIDAHLNNIQTTQKCRSIIQQSCFVERQYIFYVLVFPKISNPVLHTKIAAHANCGEFVVQCANWIHVT